MRRTAPRGYCQVDAPIATTEGADQVGGRAADVGLATSSLHPRPSRARGSAASSVGRAPRHREGAVRRLQPVHARLSGEFRRAGVLDDRHRSGDEALWSRAPCLGSLTNRRSRSAFDCLRAGGILVLGWEEWVPVPPDANEAVRRFNPVTIPPFPTWRDPTFSYTNHTFDFYAVPSATTAYTYFAAPSVTGRDRRRRA